MASVTQVIKQTKQPRGGYINPNLMEVFQIEKIRELKEGENLHPTIIGLVVDYMTRYLMGTPKEKAFEISLIGAMIAKECYNALVLLENINGIDDESIINACKLVKYDDYARGNYDITSKESNIVTDIDIFNIRTMIERSILFFKQYGPITKEGFTFEGGYTRNISTGDGDFLTRDTLWDFKVSKNKPTKNHTLQLIIYYLMGISSIHEEFYYIEKLGIFNPRLSTVYIIKIKDIDNNTINEIAKNVIGYNY